MGIHDRDYMRERPQLVPPSFTWLVLSIVGAVVLLAAAIYFVRWPPGRVSRADAIAKPKLLRTDVIDLGEFEVASGIVAICDPCYDRQTVERGAIAMKVGDVATGKWQARVIRHIVNTPDHTRCGELVAFLATEPLPNEPKWREIHSDIAVDSGQAGFFDWKDFGSPTVVPRDHIWKREMVAPDNPWYSLCCEATLHQPHAGAIPYGVVSSSGWGDGGYPVYAIRSEKDIVIGLRLVFISQAEYDVIEPK